MGKITGRRVDGPRRTVRGPAVAALLFLAIAQVSCAGSGAPVRTGPLRGVDWAVTSVAGYGPPLPGSSITATFGADGRLSGSTGCNTYTANFSTPGSRFELGPIAVTERACIERRLMRQESAFLTALGSATSWQTSGPSFVLLDSSHAVAVVFDRRGH